MLKVLSYYVSDSWLQCVSGNSGRKLVRISKNQQLKSVCEPLGILRLLWRGGGSTASWHPTWDVAAPRCGLPLPSRTASWKPIMFVGFSFHSGECFTHSFSSLLEDTAQNRRGHVCSQTWGWEGFTVPGEVTVKFPVRLEFRLW